MRWHPIVKSLHWLMAVLLLSMLGFGFMMSRLARTAATTGDYSDTLLGLSHLARCTSLSGVLLYW